MSAAQQSTYDHSLATRMALANLIAETESELKSETHRFIELDQKICALKHTSQDKEAKYAIEYDQLVILEKQLEDSRTIRRELENYLNDLTGVFL